MIQHATYPLPTNAPGELWQEALFELRLQMTKAAFNTWLADSCVLATASTPDFWVIVVRNEFASEWLTYRLCPIVSARLAGWWGMKSQSVLFRELCERDAMNPLEDRLHLNPTITPTANKT